MTVPVQTPYNSYTYAGSPTFVFGFQIILATDLQVSVAGVVQPASNYTITGVGVQTGGSILYTGALVTGQLVELQRVTVLKRSTDYQNEGDFLAATINADVDRVWQALQEQQRSQVQAIRVPEFGGVSTLPVAASRANAYLFFDGNGAPTALAAQTSATVASTTPTEPGGIVELVDIWIRRQPVTPEQFGAQADGGFYLTQMQRAVNAASSRGVPLRLNGKTYKLDVSSSSLILPIAGIEFEDGVLDISNAGANTNPIATAGTFGNPITITTPPARYATQIALSSTAGLVAGQKVLVSSSDFWCVNDSVTLREWATIASVDDATHVTFTQPLRDAYTTSPVLYAPTLTAHFIATRLRLIGGGNGLQQNAAMLQLVRNVRVYDSWTRKFANRGFQYDTCIKVEIDGGTPGEGDDSTGLSYGHVGSGATEQFSARNIYADRQRHAVTCGGTSGVVRDYTVENISGSAMTDSTVDAHPAVDKFYCRNVTHVGDITGGGADGDGIVSQARHSDIAGYKIDRPGRHGVLVQAFCSLYPSVVNIGPGEVKNHGNYASSSGWGVEVDMIGTSSAGAESIGIDAPSIESAATNANGVLVKAFTASAQQVVVKGKRVKTPGVGCKFDAATAAGKQILNADILGGYWERTNTTAENLYAQGNSAGDVNHVHIIGARTQGGQTSARLLNPGANYIVQNNAFKGWSSSALLGITNNGTTQLVGNNDTA